jgi:hypothetical protein
MEAVASGAVACTVVQDTGAEPGGSVVGLEVDSGCEVGFEVLADSAVDLEVGAGDLGHCQVDLGADWVVNSAAEAFSPVGEGEEEKSRSKVNLSESTGCRMTLACSVDEKFTEHDEGLAHCGGFCPIEQQKFM